MCVSKLSALPMHACNVHCMIRRASMTRTAQTTGPKHRHWECHGATKAPQMGAFTLVTRRGGHQAASQTPADSRSAARRCTVPAAGCRSSTSRTQPVCYIACMHVYKGTADPKEAVTTAWIVKGSHMQSRRAKCMFD